MLVLKKGNKFIAYKDFDDIGLPPVIEVGESLGSIDITNGKFVGNTACLIVLNDRLRIYNDKLKEREESIKNDSKLELSYDEVKLLVSKLEYSYKKRNGEMVNKLNTFLEKNR